MLVFVTIQTIVKCYAVGCLVLTISSIINLHSFCKCFLDRNKNIASDFRDQGQI